MVQNTLLRLRQVEDICGLKKSTIYIRLKEGTFPPPVSLGARRIAWRSNDIEDWIASRPTVEVISNINSKEAR